MIGRYLRAAGLMLALACSNEGTTPNDASVDLPPLEVSCLDQLVTITNCEHEQQTTPLLKIGVMVDDLSYTIPDEEVQDVMRAVSLELQQKTHIPAQLHGILHIQEKIPPVDREGPVVHPIFNRYIEAHPHDLPHYIVFFSGQGGVRMNGGFALKSTNLCEIGFANEFVSPVHGNSHVYGSFIDWTHRYGSCGYDRDLYVRTGEYKQVSPVSLDDGTCTNQEGIECIFNQRVDYYVCNTAYEGSQYLRYKKAYVVGTILHELLHAFGTHQNGDHFASPECDQAMGNRYYWGRLGPEITAQEWSGMCPIVFDNFENSFYSNCL